MSHAPFVLVTATTYVDKGHPRVRVNEAYTDALVAAGLIPLVLPPIDPALAVTALRGVAGLVLTGGEDIAPSWYLQEPHPTSETPNLERDAYEIALARAAREQRIPTLAICRGMQVMNVALGGSLIQDIPSMRENAPPHPRSEHRNERVHAVTFDADSHFASIVGARTITTNSMHHQAIDRVADDVRVVGTAADGIVEAIEPIDRDWWMIGMQWHPEELIETTEDWDRRLYSAFADRVRAAE